MDKEDIFIAVYTGKKFYPFNPSSEMVDIEDIAHSLSRSCRYNGHPEEHYSVAQHSVLMAENLTHQFFRDSAPPEFKMKALLHDAGESYMGDIPGPIKSELDGDFVEVEDQILETIFEKYGLSVDPLFSDGVLKKMDMQMLKYEKKYVLHDKNSWGLEDVQTPIDLKIRPWSFERAKETFLQKFYKFKDQI